MGVFSGAVCAQCGGRGRRLFAAQDLNRHSTEESFEYFRCGACGLVFMDPVPSDLGRFYPAGYHEIPPTLDDLAKRRPHELFKLEAIGADGNGKRLLEIGPSYGAFAIQAKRAGYDMHAIEMDAGCCRYLREEVQISVTHTTDVAASVAGVGRFDVITLWHSLEHLADPWTLLDVLPAHLEPGGLIAFATPNPQSVQFRVFGRHWIHLDAPRLVTLIPAAVLEARLARLGMRRIHLSSTDQGAADCNALGWLASPRFKFPSWTFRRPYTSVGWRVRERLKLIESTDLHGSAYTLVLRKE
jgi:SAM-dependent methyltransferase